jgi:Toprim domain
MVRVIRFRLCSEVQHLGGKGMTNAEKLILKLGGEWRGDCGNAPCPKCQPERRPDQRALSLCEGGGRVIVYCHKSGCDFRDICDLAENHLGGSFGNEFSHRAARPEKPASKHGQIRKAQALLKQSVPIVGSLGEIYLRHERCITCSLENTPLQFLSNAYHGPSKRSVCAMIAPVQPVGGLHRTFLELDGRRVEKDAKMMLGPCSGGAVRLSDDDGPLVVCEGIETGLSLMSGLLRGPASVWAALSTNGMKALRLPDNAGHLKIAADGDEPGRKASHTLAARAETLGWRVSILPAPEGRDWNDVLRGRRS